jgi:hypothetical protein
MTRPLEILPGGLAPGIMDREAILKILEKRTSVARERHQQAAIRFKEILQDYPSAIPQPDGTTLVQRAAQSYRRAVQELWTAQSQMVAFLVDQVIPDDLEGDG